MKCLGIDLTKYIQDLNEENYKKQMKEIKDLSKWGDIPREFMGTLYFSAQFFSNPKTALKIKSNKMKSITVNNNVSKE